MAGCLMQTARRRAPRSGDLEPAEPPVARLVQCGHRQPGDYGQFPDALTRGGEDRVGDSRRDHPVIGSSTLPTERAVV